MKRLLGVLITVLFLTTTPVSAADSYSQYNGMGIDLGCNVVYGELVGASEVYNVDILINASQISEEDISDIVLPWDSTFMDKPDGYEDFRYLEDSEWISYRAFYKEGSFTQLNLCSYDVDMHLNESNMISSFKIIYFDENGIVLYQSDEIQLTEPSFIERTEVILDVQLSGLSNGFSSVTLRENLEYRPMFIVVLIGLIMGSLAVSCSKYFVSRIIDLFYDPKKDIFFFSLLSWIVLFLLWVTVFGLTENLLLATIVGLGLVGIDFYVHYRKFMEMEGMKKAVLYYILVFFGFHVFLMLFLFVFQLFMWLLVLIFGVIVPGIGLL